MRVCGCSICRAKGAVLDPVTSAVIPGQRLGDREWKFHRRNMIAVELATTHFESVRANPSISSRPPASQVSDLSLPSPPAEQGSIHVDLSAPFLPTLQSIDATLKHLRISKLMAEARVVFCKAPTRFSKPMLKPNKDALQLLDAVAANSVIFRWELWLESAKDMVDQMQAGQVGRGIEKNSALKSVIVDKLVELQSLKMDQWEKQRMVIFQLPSGAKIVDTGRHIAKPCAHIQPAVMTCYLIVTMMHFNFGLSLKACEFLLVGLKKLVELLEASTPPLSGTIANHFHLDIPRDFETVISFMKLEPNTKTFVCCMKCFAIHPYNANQPESYPERCSFKSTSSSIACGSILRLATGTRSNRKARLFKPIRLFVYHELEDWIGDLFCRPGIEDFLDRDFGKQAPDGTIWDIWDAPELQTFLGPEGDPLRPFLQRPGNEGHLLFSLNMDGFNPFMNKEAGRKATVGGIYIVCLNFPPAIRYDVDNMFLAGVIPGPNEPSKEQINHMLRPLVDDLLDFWFHGFFLSATIKYPHGRLIRGAIMPVICDLPAARQMAGFASHSANNFCSFCTLQMHEIDNFDCNSWTSRTMEQHRVWAEKWRDAPSEKKRAELYVESGIRWSELLRLPYWDATRFLMIDSMHGFLLRLLQRHCRQIWGMDILFADGETLSFKEDKYEVSQEDMDTGNRILRSGGEKELRKLDYKILRELTRATGSLPYGGKKRKLADGLLSYRIAKGWFDKEGDVLGNVDDMPVILEVMNAATSQNQVLPEIVGVKEKRLRDDPPNEQEIARGLQVLQTGTKKMMVSLRKALLKHLCVLKSIDFNKEVCTVADLVCHLENWRIRTGVVDSSGNIIVPIAKGRKKKGTAVLGRNTLQQIKHDMDQLQLPSWVSRAPGQPGEAKCGKFTADQWRSFCLINLPFTLVRLWGSEPKDSMKHRMLDNFMELVQAIKLAFMCCMTPERIEGYKLHMHRYLSELTTLYPSVSITPYQHLSLHFPRFLERFGPVHAWRCFPFERYNYVLQQIPTNMKFGDLEQTLFKRFCMAQNIRALCKPGCVPSELDDLLSDWERLVNTDIRGTLLNDSFNFDESFIQREETITWKNHQLEPLPMDWMRILTYWITTYDPRADLSRSSNKVYMRKCIKRLGEMYQIENVSPPDSHVYYEEYGGAICAGSIQAIFSHTRLLQDGRTRTETFFVISQFKGIPAKYAHLDCYRQYALVTGRVYCQTYLSGPTIISSGQILHHFALGPIDIPGVDFPCMVALPLDRS